MKSRSVINLGWDIKSGFWLLGLLLLAAPVLFLAPLLLVFVIGAVLLGVGVWQLIQYRNLAGWNRVQGTLNRTDIGVFKVSIGQYTPPQDYYFPLVTYSYQYRGSGYESERYAFDRKSIWLTDMESITCKIAQLEAQKTLEVYVNPARPEVAVLNTEISAQRKSHACALVVSGLLVILAGGLLARLIQA